MVRGFFQNILFYPIAAVLAAGLIAISLGASWLSPAVAAQAGKIADGALVFDGAALAKSEGGIGLDTFIVRNNLSQPIGLRIGAAGAAAAPTPDDKGVRLILAPTAVDSLGPGPIVLELKTKPLPFNGAPTLFVSAQTEPAAPVQWLSAPVPTGDEPIKLQLTLQPNAKLASIGLQPANPAGAESFSVEVVELRLSRAS
jgi:hypothetical protein